MNEIRASFDAQAQHCANLGSELTARICRLFAAHLTESTAIGRRILHWSGNPSSGADALALRLMGGLHALVLSGADHELAATYQKADLLSDQHLWPIFARVLVEHEAHLNRWLDGPPQTNEVRRGVSVASVGHWLADRYQRPLVLWELGASAGLNLHWPDWRIVTPSGVMGPSESRVVLQPEWMGEPPLISAPIIRDRAGVDLAPIHPIRDRLRLLSYVWAGQPDRIERAKAALDHAAQSPMRVDEGDAIDWLAARLSQIAPGAVYLVYHTIAWQYFPKAAQERGEALLAKAGALLPEGAILARFSMERDDSPLPGAALTLQLWPEDRRFAFGRIDFHGRWIDWQPPKF